MYRIIESCMRPNGAYAKTRFSSADEAEAREAFHHAFFEGPGFGIFWSKTLSLMHSDYRTAQSYTVLGTRHID